VIFSGFHPFEYVLIKDRRSVKSAKYDTIREGNDMTLAELFGEQPRKKQKTQAVVESRVATLAAKRLVKPVQKKER
jgi:hypothetical protein